MGKMAVCFQNKSNFNPKFNNVPKFLLRRAVGAFLYDKKDFDASTAPPLEVFQWCFSTTGF